MRIIIKAVIAIAILVLVALVIDVYAYLTSPIESINQQQSVVVASGETLGSVSRKLNERGMNEKPLYLKLYARLSGKANKIKVGEYQLDPGISPMALLDLLVSGKTVQYSITIPEGWTFKQMLEALHNHEQIRATVDIKATEEIMEQVGAPGLHPEGRFLPETYFFTRNTAEIDILKRAYRSLDNLLSEEWQKRDEGLPLKTPYQALILASIVEKETAVADEREMIAAVFINRLRKNMKLQTDPTVIYGMGDAYKGNIRKKDLLRDTPYNTYTRKGLTPTPIALPSASSIRAVMHPAETEALFFVASGGGRHHFTNTYEEHREAVIKYLLGGNASRYKGDQ
ncbi:MAG: endolytic transglycosylase MltG [Gammaproteobacteria bacterium]|nr:endolytic transglycosylase MltG [Gammaproteobacteria bacterium]